MTEPYKVLNENPLTDNEREIVMGQYGAKVVWTDIEQPKRRFERIHEVVENWSRKRARRKHADIIAAVAMGLVHSEMKNVADIEYEYSHSIDGHDVTEIVNKLIINNVLTYGNDGLTLRVV